MLGGGLAGLMTTIKLAEAGHQVDILSLVPVKRSHSVCAQGGINGAVNTKGEGDSPDIHVKDTLRGGDFLAEQISVKGMCHAAPGIIYLLDRMGVPFNRTPEGLIDFRRFGGTLHHRTAFAGAWTLLIGALALMGDGGPLRAAAAGNPWVIYPLNPRPELAWLPWAWIALGAFGTLVQMRWTGGDRGRIVKPNKKKEPKKE